MLSIADDQWLSFQLYIFIEKHFVAIDSDENPFFSA
jgi:hypothetical protein